jgi:hypothetical protein
LILVGIDEVVRHDGATVMIVIVIIIIAVIVVTIVTAYMLGRRSYDKELLARSCAYTARVTDSGFAYQALPLPQDDVKQAVWVDSGCTRTVICNLRKLVNTRTPENPITIQGVGGDVDVQLVGDLPLVLRDAEGNLHKLLIKG